MSRETWTEWFTSKVKEDLRDRITTFEEVWSIMFLSSDKQAVVDSAARVAQDIIQAKDKEIISLEIRIAELEEEAAETQQELVRRREKINELTNKLHE